MTQNMSTNLSQIFGDVSFGKLKKESGLYAMSMEGKLAILNSGGKHVSFENNGIVDVSLMKFDKIDAFVFPIAPENIKEGDVILADDGTPLFILPVKQEKGAPLSFTGVSPESVVTTILPKRSIMGDHLYVRSIITLVDLMGVAARFADDMIFMMAVMANEDPSIATLKNIMMLGGITGDGEEKPDKMMMLMMAASMNGGQGGGDMSNMLPFLLMGKGGKGLGGMNPMMMAMMMGGQNGGQGGGQGGMNPMMMMALMGKGEGAEGMDMKSMMLMSMMSGQNGGQGGAQGGMNPMMMMALMGKDDKDGKGLGGMFSGDKGMMMAMMMGGQGGGQGGMNPLMMMALMNKGEDDKPADKPAGQ